MGLHNAPDVGARAKDMPRSLVTGECPDASRRDWQARGGKPDRLPRRLDSTIPVLYPREGVVRIMHTWAGMHITCD